jgi:hypothetical protein
MMFLNWECPAMALAFGRLSDGAQLEARQFSGNGFEFRAL